MMFILGKPSDAVYNVTAYFIYGEGLWGIGMRHLGSLSSWAQHSSRYGGCTQRDVHKAKGSRGWGLCIVEKVPRLREGRSRSELHFLVICPYHCPFFLVALVLWTWMVFVFYLCLSIPTHLTSVSWFEVDAVLGPWCYSSFSFQIQQEVVDLLPPYRWRNWGWNDPPMAVTWLIRSTGGFGDVWPQRSYSLITR